jgi:hypothetical protein
MRIKFQAESLSFCATGQVFVQSTLIVQSPSGESIANLKESVSFIPAGGPSDERFQFSMVVVERERRAGFRHSII